MKSGVKSKETDLGPVEPSQECAAEVLRLSPISWTPDGKSLTFTRQEHPHSATAT